MIKSRSSSHVRTKIIALLVSMTALWGFAAYVTVRDGLNVLFVNTLDSSVGRPTEALVGALQEERRASVVVLADRSAESELQVAREQTDRALADWREGASRTMLTLAASDILLANLEAAGEHLDRLPELRAAIDERDLARLEAVAGYTEVIDAGFQVYGSVSVFDDRDIARQSRTLIDLSRARELISQQDALLAGVLAARDVTRQDIAEFTKLVGTQRHLYETTSAQLPVEDQPLYEAATADPAVLALHDLQDQFIAQAAPNASPPFTPKRWQETATPAVEVMRDLELAAADRTVDRATTAAAGVVLRLVLAGGLGLIAVIAAVVISITTARSLVRQLERLRDAARELAEDRLPRVVRRLSRGEPVDVAAEAPRLEFGDDEIGQVGQAFNAVQQTAVQAAVQQAELRRGVRDVFLSLARRTQSLVHKQLGVVDVMERRETDPDEMEDLYRIDHLATRMRRNAENLIVLAGATPGRTWRRPVPMIDVIRGAVAEVEDYQRVTVMTVQAGALAGRVAGDVIHLLAELIENASSFSPPYALVGVAGQRVAHGFVVEIEDRGLGISEAELAAVNEKLANPPDFSLADASRLGHYVVAKLAERHGIKVHLRTSPYGGITAIVLIPQEIMVETEGGGDSAGVAPAQAGGDGGDGGGGPARLTVVPGGDRTTPVVRPARTASTGASGGVPRSMLDPPAGTGPLPEPGRTPGGLARRGGDRPPNGDRRPNGVATPAPIRPPAGPTPGTVGDGVAGDGAASAPAPADPPPADPPDGEERGHADGPARTPSGLPWRVRQASLPKQLLEEDAAASEESPVRDPEQVRQAMRSYQIGTQRGRSEVADDERTPTQEPPGAGPGDRKEG